MTGYGQFCPVSKAAEVVCQRWTPLILRELLVGSTHFNEIRRGVPCSPGLLTKRLRELESAGVVERDLTANSYTLTDAGKELFPLIQGLGEWGQRWVRSEYREDELDPGLLLWDVRRYLDPAGLGQGRTVVQFLFLSMPAKRRYYWVVADGREVDLCLTDPGVPVDATIEVELRTLTRIWMGDESFEDAVKAGLIHLSGSTRLTRAIPRWVGQHPILAAVAPARWSAPFKSPLQSDNLAEG